MTRTFKAYAGGVVLAGAALCAFLGLRGATPPPFGDPRFWLVAALVLVGELMPIDVPRRSGLDRITVSTAFGFAALLLFGAPAAVLTLAVASLCADLGGRVQPVKALFNAAQYSVALAAAGGALALAGEPGPVGPVGPALPAVLVAAAAFFAVNQILAGTAAALLLGESPARYLLADLPFQALTGGFVLALAPVFVASARASLGLVPLCLLPALAVHLGARRAARDAHRAVHDALTDLPNRVLLHERLDRSLAEARGGGHAVALMILDLDDFKAVNDTLGHACGDRLLQAVAARLLGELGPGDLLARLGGDEFAVLAGGPADAAGAQRLAARLTAALEASFELDGILLDVRASVGVALFPEHGDAGDELLRHADVALYCAKASERAVEVYAPAQDHYTVDRLVLAGQLRRGIDAGQIVVEYQPKYPLRGGRPEGVEALARWEHPDLGRVGPDGFIPLAEQAGLIRGLTDVVLATAIAQCGRWLRTGLALRVSVNVSPRGLTERELPGRIQALLDEHGVPARLLQLEITESRAVPTGRTALYVLESLRRMGVGLAIDDFGTGFSSLVQLQRLPVDEIKIDRSFVASMATSPSDAAIVRSTIDLARNLGLVVTAEGVESATTRAALAAMGCDLAQGFELCRPAPADRCAEAVLDVPHRFAPVALVAGAAG